MISILVVSHWLQSKFVPCPGNESFTITEYLLSFGREKKIKIEFSTTIRHSFIVYGVRSFSTSCCTTFTFIISLIGNRGVCKTNIKPTVLYNVESCEILQWFSIISEIFTICGGSLFEVYFCQMPPTILSNKTIQNQCALQNEKTSFHVNYCTKKLVEIINIGHWTQITNSGIFVAFTMRHILYNTLVRVILEQIALYLFIYLHSQHI